MKPFLGLLDANKTLAFFFSAFSGFPPNACEKAFMSRTSHVFLVISTLIFCSLCLMLLIFGGPFFWGELPHTKGVYILDFFCCINHFNSKWRMKHLALFVVGAAFLRPTRCKQNSRDFFKAPFRSFLRMLAKKRL